MNLIKLVDPLWGRFVSESGKRLKVLLFLGFVFMISFSQASSRQALSADLTLSGEARTFSVPQSIEFAASASDEASSVLSAERGLFYSRDDYAVGNSNFLTGETAKFSSIGSQPGFSGNFDFIGFSYRLLLGFMMILGLALGIRWFLMKTAGIKTGKFLRIVEVMELRQGCSVALIEVSGSFMVIGITQNGISHIANIDDPRAVELLRFAGRDSSDEFGKLLSAFLTPRSDGRETDVRLEVDPLSED
ncbi:MAG: hypothetical protein CVV64_06290 [Candidatus Wallbacteria bacterium HGW-Wallbacteria-1]|jgi:flagellar biogenesis protein FliO|uniref:Flagellar protein n=1 Tax=Candidatus Wallbacteria bacterium HGW-Wallbacteria-1 TaxID=2013854 RepID=A0A2N1PSR1_9BACT|nr:MAG: hypothetical protein CVV64_06290 [Candidatus Wallbacteria bacterium HGW-Wallbacteria-1]